MFLREPNHLATLAHLGSQRYHVSGLEATALEHDLILVTRNVRNFRNSQATILNPWED